MTKIIPLNLYEAFFIYLACESVQNEISVRQTIHNSLLSGALSWSRNVNIIFHLTRVFRSPLNLLMFMIFCQHHFWFRFRARRCLNSNL